MIRPETVGYQVDQTDANQATSGPMTANWNPPPTLPQGLIRAKARRILYGHTKSNLDIHSGGSGETGRGKDAL